MTDANVVDVGGIVAAHRGGFTFLGIALVVAGVLAIAFPLAGGLAVEVWAAAALILAGVAQVIHAFAARRWQGFILGLLVGVVYLVAGGMLWLNPLKGVVALTVLLAASILLDGVLRTVMAFQLREISGWFWMLLSGLLGIVVAIMIWRQLPSSAAWALGLLLGINLIGSGLAFTLLARSARPMSDMPT